MPRPAWCGRSKVLKWKGNASCCWAKSISTQAQLDAAAGHFTRSLHLCRDGADKRGEAKALWHLGEAALAAGDLGGARTLLSEALQAFRAADMWKELLGCLEDQSVLAHLEGRADTAVRLGATATAVRQRLGLGHSPLAETHWQERLAALRATLPDETFVAVWNEAREHWEIEDAVRAGARLASACDDPMKTAPHRGAAIATRRSPISAGRAAGAP